MKHNITTLSLTKTRIKLESSRGSVRCLSTKKTASIFNRSRLSSIPKGALLQINGYFHGKKINIRYEGMRYETRLKISHREDTRKNLVRKPIKTFGSTKIHTLILTLIHYLFMGYIERKHIIKRLAVEFYYQL